MPFVWLPHLLLTVGLRRAKQFFQLLAFDFGQFLTASVQRLGFHIVRTVTHEAHLPSRKCVHDAREQVRRTPYMVHVLQKILKSFIYG